MVPAVMCLISIVRVVGCVGRHVSEGRRRMGSSAFFNLLSHKHTHTHTPTNTHAHTLSLFMYLFFSLPFFISSLSSSLPSPLSSRERYCSTKGKNLPQEKRGNLLKKLIVTSIMKLTLALLLTLAVIDAVSMLKRTHSRLLTPEEERASNFLCGFITSQKDCQIGDAKKFCLWDPSFNRGVGACVNRCLKPLPVGERLEPPVPQTLQNGEKVRIFIVGDQGANSPGQQAVGQHLLHRHMIHAHGALRDEHGIDHFLPFHFGLSTGDNFYDFAPTGGEASEDGVQSFLSSKFHDAWNKPYHMLPVIGAVAGNHDVKRGIEHQIRQGTICNRHFSQPALNWGIWNHMQYSFHPHEQKVVAEPRISVPSEIAIFFLDSSPIYEKSSSKAEANVDRIAAMLSSFFEDAAEARWKILVCHAFFYMPGKHHGMHDTMLMSRDKGFVPDGVTSFFGYKRINPMIELLEPILNRLDVNLVITGHEHVGAFTSRMYVNGGGVRKVRHNLQVGNSGGSLDSDLRPAPTFTPGLPVDDWHTAKDKTMQSGFAHGYPIQHPQFSMKAFGFAEVTLTNGDIEIESFYSGGGSEPAFLPHADRVARIEFTHDSFSDPVAVATKLQEAYEEYAPNARLSQKPLSEITYLKLQDTPGNSERSQLMKMGILENSQLLSDRHDADEHLIQATPPLHRSHVTEGDRLLIQQLITGGDNELLDGGEPAMVADDNDGVGGETIVSGALDLRFRQRLRSLNSGLEILLTAE